MNFKRLQIPDVVLCEPKILKDERGYFSETFRQDKLSKFLGFNFKYCQENESKSSYGVLRGLHYQLPPYAQTKLVSVQEGCVLDVALDIRNGSPTFGQHVAVELSAENRRQLFIPRGFAHGFVVLSDIAIFSYKVDNYYSPNHERGIAFNDPSLSINWKLKTEELNYSKKDLNNPMLANADCFNFNINQYD